MLELNEAYPVAVLLAPVVVAARELIPTAVLKSPLVLLLNAEVPIPTLFPDTPKASVPKLTEERLLIVDSTSAIEPSVRVPSISALLSIVTVPED